MPETDSARILVVDDEPSLLAVMEQFLKRMGYEVVACRSAQQALEHFERQPESYTLVLLDIMMPNMSGEELLLRMLEMNPHVSILVCSGYPFDMSTLPAPVRKQIGFLQKPFAPKMFTEAVQELMARQREQNQQ